VLGLVEPVLVELPLQGNLRFSSTNLSDVSCMLSTTPPTASRYLQKITLQLRFNIQATHFSKTESRLQCKERNRFLNIPGPKHWGNVSLGTKSKSRVLVGLWTRRRVSADKQFTIEKKRKLKTVCDTFFIIIYENRRKQHIIKLLLQQSKQNRCYNHKTASKHNYCNHKIMSQKKQNKHQAFANRVI
jgi:hypothetical protein